MGPGPTPGRRLRSVVAVAIHLCAVAGLWFLPQIFGLSASPTIVRAAHLAAFLTALAAAPVVILGGLPRLPADPPREDR